MLLAVYYKVLDTLKKMESTREARVALNYHLVQLLRFFHALQTSHLQPQLEL